VPTLTTNDGVGLNYVERGTGPPLVIVPGWGMSTRWFERQLDGLSDRARVIVYDPRGQGDSDKVAHGQRMARLARDLEDLLAELELEGVTLLGWSLGVSTVLAYVDVFGTDRLEKVVLVCGGPRLIKSDGWELGFTDLEGTIAWRALVESDFDTAARSVVPQFFAEPPSEEDLAWMIAETTKCHPAGMGAITWNVLNQDYRDVPAKIDRPTLVVAGRHDHVIPFANGPWLAERIPGAELAVLEHSAHCPFLEEPDRFNAEIARFIA
jgi:peroxiredoxin